MAKGYTKNQGSSKNDFDPKTYVKKSGSKAGTDKNGAPYTTGWNASKRNGMVTFLATPYKGSHVVTSRSGKDWMNVMVKIHYKDQMKTELKSGLRNMATGQVIINDLGIVLSPKSKNGGYCGRIQ
jgi:hypothetical protein